MIHKRYTVVGAFLILLIAFTLLSSIKVMPVRAVQFWHKDTKTKGNWIEYYNGEWSKRYGRTGYILCGYDSKGHNDEEWQEIYDRKSLPDYISYNVSGTGGVGPLDPGKAGVYTVEAPTSDVRALIDPNLLNDEDVFSKRRNTHWFTTPYNSEEAELQVKLNFSKEAQDKYFHLSLYFLDAYQNRKLNVTITDEDPVYPQSVSVNVTTE